VRVKCECESVRKSDKERGRARKSEEARGSEEERGRERKSEEERGRAKGVDILIIRP
jgi:hypothetical protein